MPQENEKCCSYSRTGAVGSSFLLSWTGLHVSEGLTALPSIQIIQIASDALFPLAPSACHARDRPAG
jgi:hypothetical protein